MTKNGIGKRKIRGKNKLINEKNTLNKQYNRRPSVGQVYFPKRYNFIKFVENFVQIYKIKFDQK